MASRVDWGFTISALGLPALVLGIGGFGAFTVATLIVPITGLATATAGVAAYVWSRKHRCYSLWPFLIAGTLAGLIFALLPFAFAPSGELLLGLAKIFGGIGAIHGTVFWLVAIYGNDEIRVPIPATEKRS